MSELTNEIKWALEHCNGHQELRGEFLALLLHELQKQVLGEEPVDEELFEFDESDLDAREEREKEITHEGFFTLHELCGSDAKAFSSWLRQRVDAGVSERRHRADNRSVWQYHPDDREYMVKTFNQWEEMYYGV